MHLPMLGFPPSELQFRPNVQSGVSVEAKVLSHAELPCTKVHLLRALHRGGDLGLRILDFIVLNTCVWGIQILKGNAPE